MKKGQKLWTRNELILVFNLYCKLPFGKLHKSNPLVKELAQLIGRTDSAVAWKLVNFASLDPTLKARGIKGAKNASEQDEQIWNEFYNNWDDLAFESETLLATKKDISVEEMNHIPDADLPREGKVREQIVKVRVNQAFFRKTILASYNNTCCITGLRDTRLLVASHISPWAYDEANRLNPTNGIAINALHDKAFETGLLSVTPEYRIKISPILKARDSANKKFFNFYNGRKIILPSRFLPDKIFLEYHINERFQK